MLSSHSFTGLEALVAGTQGLRLSQKRELSEIFVGFDVANRYSIRDAEGQVRGRLLEEGAGLGAAFLRNVFGMARAVAFHVLDPDGTEIAVLSKGWSLFFHSVEVHSDGVLLGVVSRRWSLLGRRFSLEDAQGHTLATIRRPLLSLWTYPAFAPDGTQIATISKRWGGLFKEVFSDADTYSVAFEAPLDTRLRSLLFASMCLVDMTNTENNQGSRGLLGTFGD